MQRSAPDPDCYDVVVIGGAISGAATALLVRRWRPTARVLVVERASAFNRKVGEATVEVSAHFLTKVLGLGDNLARCHVPKHGLRFWFNDGHDRALDQMAELGPYKLPGMNSFHLDRAALDEHVLDVARQEGAEVVRPARVAQIELGWPQSTITIQPETGDGPPRTVRARWVVDASGRQTFLARRMDLLEDVPAHPTAAIWARWRNVADLDSTTMLGPDVRRPRLPRLVAGRRLSTNHFCGHGWWCWVIPLVGGETSIGLVYDKRHFEPPGSGKQRERYHDFLKNHPGLRELLANAEMDQEDFFAYKSLPYRSRQYADRGWALVGDAAAFLDPLYSSGLDHVSCSVYATARIIEDDLAGQLCEKGLAMRLEAHNGEFGRSYDRWMDAIYIDKYELLGDPDLVSASYFIDIGTYYLGVVQSMFRDLENFQHPPLGNVALRATIAHRGMTAMKARMVRLARVRRRLGISASAASPGKRMWRQYPVDFALGGSACKLVVHGVWLWWRAELDTLRHRLFARGRKTNAQPTASAPAQPM